MRFFHFGRNFESYVREIVTCATLALLLTGHRAN